MFGQTVYTGSLRKKDRTCIYPLKTPSNGHIERFATIDKERRSCMSYDLSIAVCTDITSAFKSAFTSAFTSMFTPTFTSAFKSAYIAGLKTGLHLIYRSVTGLSFKQS